MSRPNSFINHALSPDDPENLYYCTLHCDHTWQCDQCGSLVHGSTGLEKHQSWHAQGTAER